MFIEKNYYIIFEINLNLENLIYIINYIYINIILIFFKI